MVYCFYMYINTLFGLAYMIVGIVSICILHTLFGLAYMIVGMYYCILSEKIFFKD